MEDATTHRLADHLKALRLERGLSLEALARLSGISRATLSRLENAETSPTAVMLFQLATVHGIATSQLLAGVEAQPRPHVPLADQPCWTDPATGFLRRVVSPAAQGLRGEVIAGHLPAGKTIAYPAPAAPAQDHHLILLSGALTVTLDAVAYLLQPGDSLRYRLTGPTRFQTPPDSAADYHLVLI